MSAAELQVEIDTSVLKTVNTTLTNRPLNTTRKYAMYQAEFLQWCEIKRFPDQGTVTAGKLHLFLSDQVIGRSSKKNAKNIIGHSSVCGYANAIVDLYNQQSNMRMNSHPHPRDTTVKQLLRNVQQQTTAIRKKNYADRGNGSLLDGYQSTQQFVDISLRFFVTNNLRGRACFLLSHYGLLRGENIRELELADMFSQPLGGEGFSECTALVLLIQHGKTNQYGKLQHVGYMRNKDVRVCPVGAAAMYLFERFHLDKECFPDLRASSHWYDLKLLRGRDKKAAISYQVHKKSFETVFNSLGLTFNKKTHINRQQGVRELENADVDVSQTRRHGRWGVDSCEGIYSAPLAREAMRGLSGHPPKERLYYIPRSNLAPPSSLQEQIFPEADEILQKVISADGYERNLAARGFLELVVYLRRVLLQDSAVFIAETPGCRMWSHPIFQSQEFRSFQRDLLLKIDTTPDPTELRLQQSLPLLSVQLRNQHSSLSAEVKGLVELVKQGNDLLQRFVRDGMYMRVSPVTDHQDGALLHARNSTQHQVQGPLNDQNVDPPPAHVAYEMSRGLTRVSELWKEWHEGIGSSPSVISMEKKHGTKWRFTSKDSKFFSRRKVIIDHVNHVMKNRNVDANAALAAVEREQGAKSLDALSKYLSQQNRK